MAFWGLEVKPGKPYTLSPDHSSGRLRIAQATIGSGSSTKKSVLQCHVGDRSPILLCSLMPDKTESCALGLEFDEEVDVVFSVIGPRSVHLSGYYMGSGYSGRDGDETDSYGEDIAETDTDESDSQSSDEDEYEDDFIDDGDIKMLDSSPTLGLTRSKCGVIIEEIKDEEKSVKFEEPSHDSKNPTANCMDRNNFFESENEDDIPILSLLPPKSNTKNTVVEGDTHKCSAQIMSSADGNGFGDMATDVEQDTDRGSIGVQSAKKDKGDKVNKKEKLKKKEEDCIKNVEVETAKDIRTDTPKNGTSEEGNICLEQDTDRVSLGIQSAKKDNGDKVNKKENIKKKEEDCIKNVAVETAKNIITDAPKNGTSEESNVCLEQDTDRVSLGVQSAKDDKGDKVNKKENLKKNEEDYVKSVEIETAKNITIDTPKNGTSEEGYVGLEQETAEGSLGIQSTKKDKGDKVNKKEKLKKKEKDWVKNIGVETAKNITTNTPKNGISAESNVCLEQGTTEGSLGIQSAKKDKGDTVNKKEKRKKKEKDQVKNAKVETATSITADIPKNDSSGENVHSSVETNALESNGFDTMELDKNICEVAASADPTSREGKKKKNKNKKRTSDEITYESIGTILDKNEGNDVLPTNDSVMKIEKKAKKGALVLDNVPGKEDSDSMKHKELSVCMEEQGAVQPMQARSYSNGFVVEELQMGEPDGKRATSGKKVSVNYVGRLKNGEVFDSNVGQLPFSFRLGVGEVIKGWDFGVNGMRVGDKRRLTIPPSMGYGSKGAGKIPPNSWLVFDVELVKTK